MSLFSVTNWLRTPADRDVIQRWTVGGDQGGRYDLSLPQPPNPGHWEFLALGDTGDAEAAGVDVSPQDAVAQEMERDAAIPNSEGKATMILHMGDVVYMTGERRLYDRNFRRPYSRFLTDESTVDQLTFRLPFLPVPGNHDYYDLGQWALWLSRVPIVGAGLRAMAQRLFAFSLPEGGSDMGRAYMRAFVDRQADTTAAPLPYLPGERTLLPNRYYRFTVGGVDFFALDSNTLDAPAGDPEAVRADATARLAALENQSRQIDTRLRRGQRAIDRACEAARESAARDPALLEDAVRIATEQAKLLGDLESALRALEAQTDASHNALDAVRIAARHWTEGAADLAEASDENTAASALEALNEASAEGCEVLRAVEAALAEMPEGNARARILGARAEVEKGQDRWSARILPVPDDLMDKVRRLSEEALDIQRNIATERRRQRYRAEDYDAAQLEWLRRSLDEAVEQRPDNWRIVYLHHPLYTTIGNHVEGTDVTSVRDNLLPLLKERVHAVIAGHAHAFEWFRSDAFPDIGIFTTGGGGQIALRPSILDPARFRRHPDRYEALREAGVRECAVAGHSPRALDGESGPIYHYLRVEVTPETLRICPVGVRRRQAGYRREEPMPVNHVSNFDAARPPWKVRALTAVEVRRGEAPRPVWG